MTGFGFPPLNVSDDEPSVVNSLQSILMTIQSPQVRERNKEFIRAYFDHLKVAKPGLSAFTLRSYAQGLYRFARLCEVDFDVATRQRRRSFLNSSSKARTSRFR